MRSSRLALVLSAAGFAGLLALNWRAQLRTQEKLDALAAALADRPAATPATPPAPNAAPREPGHATLPPYVIEAPDLLVIEAVLRDPKTGTTDRLPVQPISGQFLVRPDGTVGLGVWGSVPVAGLTTEQAGGAIRTHLAGRDFPELAAENLVVVVDVLAHNSKAYYVITDAPGGAEQVAKFPLTGNESVLDAVTSVSGLADAAGKQSVWVARESAGGTFHVLPVDWAGITRRGLTATNYQLLPGDRVYVKNAGG